MLALTCLHGEVIVELVQHSHGHILLLGLAELQGTDRDRDTRQQWHGDSGSAAPGTRQNHSTGVWLGPAPPAPAKSPEQGNIPAQVTLSIFWKSLPRGTG